jgi:hypothetical protein
VNRKDGFVGDCPDTMRSVFTDFSHTCECDDGYTMNEEFKACEPIEASTPDEPVDPEFIPTEVIPEPRPTTTEKVITEPVILTTARPFVPTTEDVGDYDAEYDNQEGCLKGFDYDDYGGCSDVDECQTDNGGCHAMCMNFYGSFHCYEDLGIETKLCHHDYVSDPNAPYGAGYRCTCYDGYKLCLDGFTCVAIDASNIPPQTGDDTACSNKDNVYPYNGKCYAFQTKPATYKQAVANCEQQGAKLASLDSRKLWWMLGDNVGEGFEPYWINNDSDEKLANMHIVKANKIKRGSGMVANLMENLAQVPPQWDVVDSGESFRYYCETSSGIVDASEDDGVIIVSSNE